MIYTITFNPALDYHVQVEHFHYGEVNRTASERLLAGGKGINVSTVLHHLGTETTALGFLAGFTGQTIAALMAETGVPADFITLPEGASRINIKLHTDTDTEINGIGAPINTEALAELFRKLSAMQAGDTLVLAGSVPAGLPDTIYCDMMERLQPKGIRFAVDATGDLLRKTLAFQPFLIKPNHHELGELFGVRLGTPREAERYARRLQDMGAQNVLVSMGEKGALLISADGKAYFRRALQGKAVNTTGAGDSMLAGFLAGWERFQDAEKALHMGLAAASVSVFSGHLADKEKTEELFEHIQKAVQKQG